MSQEKDLRKQKKVQNAQGDNALNPIFVNAVTSNSKAATSVNASVAASATSVLILAANVNRKGVYITNYPQATQRLYLRYGSAAVVGRGLMLLSGDSHYEDTFTGDIFGVWSAANSGLVDIMELN